MSGFEPFLGWLGMGFFPLPAWGYCLLAALAVYTTVLGVTVCYHRAYAHRALRLNPSLAWGWRLWIWLTTGMAVSQWMAVHRLHHAKADRAGDPHSPRVLGLAFLIRHGIELYAAASAAPAVVIRYAPDAPRDRLERFSASHHNIGIAALGVAELVLLGAPGLALWSMQMLAMPILASALVNGVASLSINASLQV
jgi:stearoyl-CoA desaturase (delta-9 desaturase)